MKPIWLLDNSLGIEIYFSNEDCDLDDNICIRIVETCPEEEKVFIHEESQLFITRNQAQELASALTAAIHQSEEEST